MAAEASFLCPIPCENPPSGLSENMSSCLADPTSVKCLQLLLLAALVRWEGKPWGWVVTSMGGHGWARHVRSEWLFHVLLMQPERQQPPKKRRRFMEQLRPVSPTLKTGWASRRGIVRWMIFVHNPFQLPHSSGCSARQKKHSWEVALIFGGWQPLLPLSCLSLNTKRHPWKGQICSTITSHFSYLPPEPSCHLCELLQTDSLPQTNTIM